MRQVDEILAIVEKVTEIMHLNQTEIERLRIKRDLDYIQWRKLVQTADNAFRLSEQAEKMYQQSDKLYWEAFNANS